MGKIVVKDTFVIKSILETNVKFKDCIIVYGQIIVDDVLEIGDELIDDSRKGFKCKVIDFPLIRKIPYLKDHIHIIVKPTVSGYSLEDVKDMLLSKM
ncbi:hypothetical protein LOZ80_12065 [Paenibacillus sp. HWE-109]|uniref:hypothetical protein n=1 Tax=Paenibacillus sp. HWE-109 TaxID=1306526 RepID=UPI001EDE25FB|nr:hypothetical protein [Paenibacillus sp. HWE-109]UKS29620.1 hypothetical protein LOZ80_12065 [Paenibacillus sp. HWE-109]